MDSRVDQDVQVLKDDVFAQQEVFEHPKDVEDLTKDASEVNGDVEVLGDDVGGMWREFGSRLGELAIETRKINKEVRKSCPI